MCLEQKNLHIFKMTSRLKRLFPIRGLPAAFPAELYKATI